jgi:uncharacterized protein YjiK
MRTVHVPLGLLTLLALLIPCIAPAEQEEVGLDKYKVAGEAIVLPEVEDDASAITFSPETGSLFVALNNPPTLIELEMDGKVKRTVKLQGFQDTEGVAWIEGQTFAVIEERRRNLVLVEIGPQTESVSYQEVLKFLVEPQPSENRGIEGIASDSDGKRLFIVKEREPRRLYEVELPAEAGELEIGIPWDLEKTSHGMKDVAGLFFHAATSHLLILSDQSKCIVECTLDGEEVARLKLTAGSAGLTADIGQPEGITMDDKGNLYICSEPNLVYIFKK